MENSDNEDEVGNLEDLNEEQMDKLLQLQVCVTHFLGPRGPLVEPSNPRPPVHPSATIFPEFIYTGIHALWIIRSLIKPIRWHKGIP